MSKATKPKKEKTISTQFYGVNIKLLSKNRKGPDMYEDLFRQIFHNNTVANVGADKAMMFLSMNVLEREMEGQSFKQIWGNMVKFTVLESDDWLDLRNKEVVKYEIPKDYFPGSVQAEYLFIPYAHRFYFRTNSKISIPNVINYFTKVLNELAGEDETVSVTAIASHDAIQKIIDSDKVVRLKIDVTYTNDDLGSEALEEMDGLLKESGVGKTSIDMVPINKEQGLATQGTFVSGLLELARENGEAEATIKNEEGKSEKVITKNHPARELIISKLTENPVYKLFEKVVAKRYRNAQRKK